MKNVISLKELRENMPKYEARVAKGDSFIVFKRSKPIFRIAPVEDEAGWETVIDFTKLRKGGMPADELIERLKSLEKYG